MKISQNEKRKTVYKKRCLAYWGEKRKQKGGAIPLGLLASVGAPILGEIAKSILKKFFGRGRKRRRGLRPKRRR